MRAAIYVRVSSQDQVSGFSLDVQERVCRDYCERHGLAVAIVSREEGESAKTADRKQLQSLLSALRRQGHGITRLVVYDLTRFTRDTSDYLTLKGFLAGVGVQLVAVTQPIEETPTGRFMGTVLAAQGQLDNEIKRERTVAGMREAIRNGIWPWQPPIGYLSHRGRDRKSTLIHDPERAPLVRLAFERVAAGLVTQEEARVEMKARGLSIPRETFSRMLHSPLYCGRIVAPKWGVEGRASFRPIVSEETWRKAQEALSGAPQGWRRSEIRPDFPLRWWTCCTCGAPLTGGYSRGKAGGKYPYYRCRVGCFNAHRDFVASSFSSLLDTLTVPAGLWRLQEAAIREAWSRRESAQRSQAEAVARRSRALEAREEKIISALLDGNLDGATVKRMRARIATERADLAAAMPTRLPDLELALRHGRRLLEGPRAAWDAVDPSLRPKFLRVAFPARLAFDPKTGFRTPAKSLFQNNITGSSGPDCEKWYPQWDDGNADSQLTVWIAAGAFMEAPCRTPDHR